MPVLAVANGLEDRAENADRRGHRLIQQPHRIPLQDEDDFACLNGPRPARLALGRRKTFRPGSAYQATTAIFSSLVGQIFGAGAAQEAGQPRGRVARQFDIGRAIVDRVGNATHHLKLEQPVDRSGRGRGRNAAFST